MIEVGAHEDVLEAMIRVRAGDETDHVVAHAGGGFLFLHRSVAGYSGTLYQSGNGYRMQESRVFSSVWRERLQTDLLRLAGELAAAGLVVLQEP